MMRISILAIVGLIAISFNGCNSIETWSKKSKLSSAYTDLCQRTGMDYGLCRCLAKETFDSLEDSEINFLTAQVIPNEANKKRLQKIQQKITNLMQSEKLLKSCQGY